MISKHLATWREAEVKLLQVIQAKKEQLGDDLKMCDVSWCSALGPCARQLELTDVGRGGQVS